MEKKYPCDACKAHNKASGCSNCVWDNRYSDTCGNYDCEFYYEGDCRIGFADECKASDNYQDDLIDHDCSECVNFGEGNYGLTYCRATGEEIGRWDYACENYEERFDESEKETAEIH